MEFPRWWMPTAIGSAITLIGIGLTMIFPGKGWVGAALVAIGVSLLVLTIGRYWWYLTHSYEYYEFGTPRRVTFSEFHKWTDERKNWLRDAHPGVYRAIEKEDSDRVGPPGRPLAKWDGESEIAFLRRIGVRCYVGVLLHRLSKKLLRR